MISARSGSFSPIAGLPVQLLRPVRCERLCSLAFWAAPAQRVLRLVRAVSSLIRLDRVVSSCTVAPVHGPASLGHRLPARVLRLGAFVVLTLGCAFALAPAALAGLAGEVSKVTGHMVTTAGLVRNFLYGMAVFGLIGIGVAAWFGRVPYKWLFALGGGVFLLALSGLLIDQFIEGGHGAGMAAGGIK